MVLNEKIILYGVLLHKCFQPLDWSGDVCFHLFVHVGYV